LRAKVKVVRSALNRKSAETLLNFDRHQFNRTIFRQLAIFRTQLCWRVAVPNGLANSGIAIIYPAKTMPTSSLKKTFDLWQRRCIVKAPVEISAAQAEGTFL